MTLVVVAATLVALVAIAAAWDALRRALRTQERQAEARIAVDVQQRLDGLTARLDELEVRVRDVSLAGVRRR